MKKCFSTMNLLNIIAKYLKYKDIFNFSLTNKSIHYLLNEENNPFINSLFRDLVFNKYYNINNRLQFYNEIVMDDNYKISKKNWKNIFKNLFINSQIFLDKEISELIYNSFKDHYYLPYQRKVNAILEYENSTFHQLMCYDIKKKDLIEKNYYDKFFKKSINGENSNIKIEPLRKELVFEKELANFHLEVNTYKENKNIVKMIIDYAYEELDKLYNSNFSFDIDLDRDKDKKEYKNNSKNKRNFNLIYCFLIWLNHTFILFTSLLYNYVIHFKESGSPKKIISSYSKTHSNLINFGLLINEKLNNVNIIINYIREESESPEIEHIKKFSIYEMLLNLMQKNFYQKLKPILSENIEKMIKNFNEENLQKKKINVSFDSNNIETSNSEIINDENNVADDDNYDLYLNDSGEEDFSLEEDNDLNDEDNNMTDQETIEQYFNLILDFSINGENSPYINHSKINLNQTFIENENLLINIFLDNIRKKFVIKEEKEYLNENNLFEEEVESLNEIYSLLKKYSKSDSNKNGNINLINRTKLNILKSSENIVLNYLQQINNRKFICELKNEKGNKEANGNSKNTVNYISVNDLNLNDKKYYNKTENFFFINKLDDLKNNLINWSLNMTEIKRDKIEELAARYINNNENKLIMITKDIIYLYNSQYNLFSLQDKKILDELFKDKNNKHDKLFNLYFQN